MAASTETDRLDNPLMPPRIRLKPGLIATVYVALAGLWSVVSNAIGELFPMGDRHLEAIVDIANEFAFIAVSGALLYFVLAWSRRNLLTARESLGRIAEASDADRRRVGHPHVNGVSRLLHPVVIGHLTTGIPRSSRS